MRVGFEQFFRRGTDNRMTLTASLR